MSPNTYIQDESSLQPPACSVVFVLHNAQYEIERRLSPFFSEQLNAEIIIIDDASEDGTDNAVNSLLDHYDYEAAVYLRNENRRGMGLCLNEALLHASAPMLFIVDISIEIDIETMRRALALLEHSDAAFCLPSGSGYGDFEILRHHIFEHKVPASAAFLIHTERISSEQLFFNPFIKQGHAADLRLRTAAHTHMLEVAAFITGVNGQANTDFSHLLMELSQQESSVMAFHARNSAAAKDVNAALSPSEDDPSLLFKRALSLKLDGRITDALHLCDEILHQYPGHDDAEELKIELLQRLKQFVGASERKHQRNLKRQEQKEKPAELRPEMLPDETTPPPAREAVKEEVTAEQQPPEETKKTEPAPEAIPETGLPETEEPSEPEEAAPTSPEFAAEPDMPPQAEETEVPPVQADKGREAVDDDDEVDDDDDDMLIDPRFLPDTDFFDDDDEETPENIQRQVTEFSTKLPDEAPPPSQQERAQKPEPEKESSVEPEAPKKVVAPEEPEAQKEEASAQVEDQDDAAFGKPLKADTAEDEQEPLRPASEIPESNGTAEVPKEKSGPAGFQEKEPEEHTPAAKAPESSQPEEEKEPEQHLRMEEESAAEASSQEERASEEEPEQPAEEAVDTSQEHTSAEEQAREQAAQSPYKRPMNFHYTIVMPIAGMALEMLEECLLKLEENCDPGKTELIIIDNACLDETHEYLKQLSSHKFFHLHVITNRRNQGFGRSVNQGIAKALGEYICILHNDVALDSDLLYELSEILNQNQNIGLVGPKTDKSVNPEQVGKPENNALATEDATYLDSFCMMMRAEDNYRFSEDYAQAWFDDADLSFQVQQSGKRVVIAAGVFLPHYSGSTTEQLGFGLDSELYQKNLAHFNNKWNIEPPTPDIEEAEHPLAEIYELGQVVNVYYPDEKHVARIQELYTPAMEAELQRQKDLEDEALIYFIRAMMAIDNRPSLRMLEEQLKGKLEEVYVLELVRYYYQRHIYSRCKKHMQRVKGQPGLWFAMYQLRIAYQDKEVERIAELLNDLLDAYPAHPEINKIAGDMYQFLGDKAESEAFYSLVDQIDPFHYARSEEE